MKSRLLDLGPGPSGAACYGWLEPRTNWPLAQIPSRSVLPGSRGEPAIGIGRSQRLVACRLDTASPWLRVTNSRNMTMCGWRQNWRYRSTFRPPSARVSGPNRENAPV